MFHTLWQDSDNLHEECAKGSDRCKTSFLHGFPMHPSLKDRMSGDNQEEHYIPNS
jgi:hypothetical protein